MKIKVSYYYRLNITLKSKSKTLSGFMSLIENIWIQIVNSTKALYNDKSYLGCSYCDYLQ